ncbi:MAG: DUF4838 domain-containing protein [Lentisphaerae bacterium]|jgi:hypothetical protein|nr:DUF4838 domain-containing protein [Lentisphaerota bacterium]MBT4814902.1 DUF4838 domain-containing protein [Lentisphaerota bacterium]MBT5609096.1 DUF4838 domain-containing protein [Lentisphaerota bacterium]MBT7057257.1 DUF4838 domain-containing protein [Lentisphaerota bacterium]MBT7848774.1 DUF4838 domain-containing protein [Lentisphaerota bacterium]
MKLLTPCVIAGLSACIVVPPLTGATLSIATNGSTTYRVVTPADPSSVDTYALLTLTNYLTQVTGADFPVVAPGQAIDGSPSIFVGLSGPACTHLGSDPLAGLDDQEHVSRTIGANMFLYGKGVHGNLHAVMEFLENSLGWRWYSVYEKPVIPSRPTVTLAPFNRKRGFSFASREVGLRHSLDFYYQNGMNMGFDRQARKRKRHNIEANEGIISFMPNPVFVHSLHRYIPPDPDNRYGKAFDWLERRNYFETNPEYFSVGRGGQRVKNRQLCFGNPALRKELTRNILKHISIDGENIIVTLDACDTPDSFCYCDACKALESKYGGRGGPIYDYLFELCDLLKTKHPGVMVKTLAYRRSQTQKPPVLAEGQKLPDNLIISFAPIEDCYFADWTHPDPRIQETYSDLKAWGKITTHLWAWMYPNPWGTGDAMPVGNVRRVINNMRLMADAGVEGVFTDHNGFLDRAGWSELQSYLLYKLMQDVNCDTDALIEQFTDHQYGPAAFLVRQYLEELEAGRQAMTVLPPGVGYRSSNYDKGTFPYLTVENIHRWQTLFDRMETQAGEQAERLQNIRALRRELDFATLWRWFDLQKAYPEYFKDHTVHAERIAAANKAKAPAGMTPRPLGEGPLKDFLAIIKGGGKSKPLPPEFATLDPSLVKQAIPRNYGRGGEKTVEDAEAAYGYAATVHNPDMPFRLGFYQWESRHPPKGTHGARLSLEHSDIIPGAYRLYKLGKITITPDSWIWFSAKSWGTRLEVGSRIYEPGEDNLWTAYVSLKLNGPSYGGKAEEDQVLCDRIILVRDDGKRE